MTRPSELSIVDAPSPANGEGANVGIELAALAFRVSDTVELIAALGHPGAGAITGRAYTAPHPRPIIAREPALTIGALVTLRDCDLDASIGRDPSSRFAFMDHVAVDDLHPEPILRVAGAAAGADHDAPGAVEIRRCPALGARLGVALRGAPLPAIGLTGARVLAVFLAGLAGRAELAAILVNQAGPLCKCFGCHQRAEADEQAQ